MNERMLLGFQAVYIKLVSTFDAGPKQSASGFDNTLNLLRAQNF